MGRGYSAGNVGVLIEYRNMDLQGHWVHLDLYHRIPYNKAISEGLKPLFAYIFQRCVDNTHKCVQAFGDVCVGGGGGEVRSGGNGLGGR